MRGVAGRVVVTVGSSRSPPSRRARRWAASTAGGFVRRPRGGMRAPPPARARRAGRARSRASVPRRRRGGTRRAQLVSEPGRPEVHVLENELECGEPIPAPTPATRYGPGAAAPECRDVEARPGEPALALADALACSRRGLWCRADRPAGGSAQPVERPPAFVVEPADLPVDALRGEGAVSAAPAGTRQARQCSAAAALMAAPAPDGRSGDPRGRRRPGRQRVREAGAEGGVVHDLGARPGVEERHRHTRARHGESRCARSTQRPPVAAVGARQREPDLGASRAPWRPASRPAGGAGVGCRRRGLGRGRLARSQAAEHRGAQDARARSLGCAPRPPGKARATVSGVPSSVTASTSRASGLCRR